MSLSVDLESKTYFGQQAGIRVSGGRLRLKTILSSVNEWVRATVGPGFIDRAVGALVRAYTRHESTFLDLGCGSMRLRQYLLPGCTYNAIDMSMSEFTLRSRVLSDPSVNFCFGLANRIPAPAESVDVCAASEVLEHVPNVDEAFQEIRRILRPGGYLLLSIPNNYQYKYDVVGKNPDHINEWRFDEFSTLLGKHGFSTQIAYRRGLWIPIRHRHLQNFYLPIQPSLERRTSNFFYACQRN